MNNVIDGSPVASVADAMGPSIAQFAALEASLVGSLSPALSNIASMIDVAILPAVWLSFPRASIIDASARLFDDMSIGLGLSGYLAAEPDGRASAEDGFDEIVRNAWSASGNSESAMQSVPFDVTTWVDADGHLASLPQASLH